MFVSYSTETQDPYIFHPERPDDWNILRFAGQKLANERRATENETGARLCEASLVSRPDGYQGTEGVMCQADVARALVGSIALFVEVDGNLQTASRAAFDIFGRRDIISLALRRRILPYAKVQLPIITDQLASLVSIHNPESQLDIREVIEFLKGNA